MEFLDALPEWIFGPLFLAAVVALIAWLILRNPQAARLSAEAVGNALSLPALPAPHPRMRHFGGKRMDLQVEVASEANFMAIYEPVPVAHAYGSSIVLRVTLPRPLPVAFRIDSSRGAEGNVDPREAGLNGIFKVWTDAPEGFRRLFGPAPVGKAVLALFGKTPDGSGRIVRLDERGVYVHYAEPKPELAVQLAHAMVHVANLLAQRDGFGAGQ